MLKFGKNMLNYKSKFISKAIERGLLYQSSNLENMDQYLYECEKSGKPGVGYAGFDMTAKSLHVGNLVSIMILKLFEECGHKPIILLGEATTRIGDPSFKNEARPLLSHEQIKSNMQSIKGVFGKILTRHVFVNNIDWQGEIKYLDILREVGASFSINKMIALDIFKRRIENKQNLTFLEFNYIVLQGYDFLFLNREHGCRIQFGGSDQWSNILAGVDLIRRKENTESFSFTSPLITKSSGEKMGKSVNGAIWLNSEMLSPHNFWQFWRNTDDKDVEDFLKIYTNIEIEKIKSIVKEDINQAKIILADFITKMIHGEVDLNNSLNSIKVRVENSKKDHDINYKYFAIVDPAKNEIHSKQNFINVVDIVTKTGVSKTKAREILSSGGVKVELNDLQDLFKVNIERNSFEISEERRLQTLTPSVDPINIKTASSVQVEEFLESLDVSSIKKKHFILNENYLINPVWSGLKIKVGKNKKHQIEFVF